MSDWLGLELVKRMNTLFELWDYISSNNNNNDKKNFIYTYTKFILTWLISVNIPHPIKLGPEKDSEVALN